MWGKVWEIADKLREVFKLNKNKENEYILCNIVNRNWCD